MEAAYKKIKEQEKEIDELKRSLRANIPTIEDFVNDLDTPTQFETNDESDLRSIYAEKMKKLQYIYPREKLDMMARRKFDYALFDWIRKRGTHAPQNLETTVDEDEHTQVWSTPTRF